MATGEWKRKKSQDEAEVIILPRAFKMFSKAVSLIIVSGKDFEANEKQDAIDYLKETFDEEKLSKEDDR